MLIVFGVFAPCGNTEVYWQCGGMCYPPLHDHSVCSSDQITCLLLVWVWRGKLVRQGTAHAPPIIFCPFLKRMQWQAILSKSICFWHRLFRDEPRSYCTMPSGHCCKLHRQATTWTPGGVWSMPVGMVNRKLDGWPKQKIFFTTHLADF